MLRLLRVVWRRVSFAHWRCLRRIAALERSLGIGLSLRVPLSQLSRGDIRVYDWEPAAVWPVSPNYVQVLSERGLLRSGHGAAMAQSASVGMVVCIDRPRSAPSVTAG